MAVNTTWVNPSASLDLATGGTITEAWVDGVASDLLRLGGTAGLLQTTNAGLVLVNDAANAKMTIGLTINQGANDDEILAFKSSDVAHGITDSAETDTFGAFAKSVAASGGLTLSGYSGGTIGLYLLGCAAADDTTKAADSNAYIQLVAGKKSGTGLAAAGANANLLRVSSYGTVRFLLDSDGDSHQDVGTAWTNFDDQDDLALLTALSVGVSRPGDPIKDAFRGFLEAHRETLERAKLVTFNDDNHHFVNMSKLTMLLTGAVRQLGQRNAQLMDRLAAIESRLELLPEGGR